MIPYNVDEKKLMLPEYGRNIQRMIDHCLEIENRDERTRCACTIADIMANMFPAMVGDEGDRRKIWDHLVIMSDFKLDVDFPCQVLDKSELEPSREILPYNNTFFKYRHYGRNIQAMMKVVAEMESCIEKDQLIFLMANQMKKLLVQGNPENASDEKIFQDIADLSGGKIVIEPGTYRLNDYMGGEPTQQKGKKKKK